MIEGVSKVVIEVEDQDRARAFWTEKLAFELVQDTSYGDERWVEVRPPDKTGPRPQPASGQAAERVRHAADVERLLRL